MIKYLESKAILFYEYKASFFIIIGQDSRLNTYNLKAILFYEYKPAFHYHRSR